MGKNPILADSNTGENSSVEWTTFFLAAHRPMMPSCVICSLAYRAPLSIEHDHAPIAPRLTRLNI